MKAFLRSVVLGVVSLALCFVAMADQPSFVGSKNSTKYHVTTCVVAKQIDKANLVAFKTPEEAVKAGYTPCQKCNPPVKSDYLVGSANSTVYHKPGCGTVQKVASENMVYFNSKADAVKAGYKPCQICFPPDVKSSAEKPAAADKGKKSNK